jgi:hypothetical protein
VITSEVASVSDDDDDRLNASEALELSLDAKLVAPPTSEVISSMVSSSIVYLYQFWLLISGVLLVFKSPIYFRAPKFMAILLTGRKRTSVIVILRSCGSDRYAHP